MFVQCKQCMTTAFAGPGQDPHTVLKCSCCTKDHHHGRAANVCADDPGHQCWTGPLSGPRHPDCRVCRPILFLPNAEVTPAGLVLPTGMGGPN